MTTEWDREDQTIAVLVEQAKGFLELGDLVVRKLLRHASSAIDLTKTRRKRGEKERSVKEWEEEKGA